MTEPLVFDDIAMDGPGKPLTAEDIAWMRRVEANYREYEAHEDAESETWDDSQDVG